MTNIHHVEDTIEAERLDGGFPGKLKPSFICPSGCGFHAWLTLSDWRI